MELKIAMLLFLLAGLSYSHLPNSWDYFVFTQQWPTTVCSAWQAKGAKNKCVFPLGLESWTIHGLWPSQVKGSSPQFCNSSQAFNETVLQGILTDLEEYWPNIYKGEPEDIFWSHEWKKHGTCAITDDLIKDEYGYFNTGLMLQAKYNITKSLATDGIVPDQNKSYLIGNVVNTMQSQYGVTPIVTCYNDKNNTRYLIKEISLCLNKALELINCTTCHGSCPSDGVVYYLPESGNNTQEDNDISHSEL